MPPRDSFAEYRALLLQQIEDLKSGMARLEEKIDQLSRDMNARFSDVQTDIAMLKVKAGMVGGLAGAVLGAFLGAVAAKLAK